MTKEFNYVLPTLLIFFLLISCASEQNKQEKVIVKVGNEALTLNKLRKEIPPLQKRFLTHEQVQNYIQRWTEDELLYQEAIRKNLNKSEELNQVLEKAKKDFLIDKLMSSLLSQELHISEQEIINYYEMNKDNFIREQPEIRAFHILAADESEAEEVRRRLLRGEDFEKVAKEVSLDYKRKQRIDLEYFSPEDVIPEIAMNVFNWSVGSITRPIKSEFGFHIFKIINKKPSNTVRDYNEVKDKIAERLLAKKKEELYRDYINTLKSKIEIKTNFDYLNELYGDSLKIDQMGVPDSVSK